MILTQSFLREQAEKRNITDYSERTILSENNLLFSAKAIKNYDIFLSHSYLDKKLVLTLIKLFNETGYSVYVDWIVDTQLNRNNITKATAKTLRERMNNCKSLSYIATSNSTNSKWCPWELGYFDGISKNSRCCILPALEYSQSSFQGQEYLGLYPYLEYEKVRDSDKYNFWVYDQSTGGYVILYSWLNGSDPYVR